MSGERLEEDPLSRWLAGEGLVTLDAITREAPDVIGVLDRDLRIRYLNYTGPGMTREAALGRSVVDLAPPDYQEIARERYSAVLQSGVPSHYEQMYRDPEGHVRMWDVRVGPIRFEGRVVGLIGITTNVTEQRRAEADRDRFFSLSLDLLVVATPDGSLRRVNPAFAEALGYDVSELTGVLFIDFVHPDDLDATRAAARDVREGKPVSDFENRFRRKDGAYRMFSWRATVDPITRDVYAVARDITIQRQTEAQLLQAQKMEAVGQLAGGIAHDFNNLMFTVLVNAEFAEMDVPPSSEAAARLRDIEDAGRRAADLTKQLLAFSRRQPLRPTTVNLNELTRGLMNLLGRLLPEHISVQFLPAAELESVNADPTQLEQVIVNLCVNARDAMEHGGKLTIRTQNVQLDERYCEAHPWATVGDYVELTVTDDGAGMAAEVRERAFEPFFTTKGPHRGTGLGLSMVYGIVQQHGGFTHVDSAPGSGTTFDIYLPAASGDAALRPADTPSRAPGGRETILLAEDEEHVRRVIVQILEYGGYRTIATANGLEAIAQLEANPDPIRLALLDVVMPELGGPATWERLQQLKPDLRVLFASGYADTHYLERLPPDAEVLEKPFRADDLLRRVRKLLDGE